MIIIILKCVFVVLVVIEIILLSEGNTWKDNLNNNVSIYFYPRGEYREKAKGGVYKIDLRQGPLFIFGFCFLVFLDFWINVITSNKTLGWGIRLEPKRDLRQAHK